MDSIWTTFHRELARMSDPQWGSAERHPLGSLVVPLVWMVLSKMKAHRMHINREQQGSAHLIRQRLPRGINIYVS